jgi:Chromate transporter
MTAVTEPGRGRIMELVTYFLRLGLLGFGGPVALVGQMERELVADRGWLTKEQMRESIAICQSLPRDLAACGRPRTAAATRHGSVAGFGRTYQLGQKVRR